MKEVIYLVVSRHRVERMTKRLPELHRGEIPVKLIIEVDPKAFREPVIEQRVHIADWREGVDVEDVELRESIITEGEAQLIREQRFAAMRGLLESQGFQVTAPEAETEPEQ